MRIDARIFDEFAAAIAAGKGQAPAAGFIVLPITAGEAATIAAFEALPAASFKPGFTSQMFSVLPGDRQLIDAGEPAGAVRPK